jgi:hypothetical protein
VRDCPKETRAKENIKDKHNKNGKRDISEFIPRKNNNDLPAWLCCRPKKLKATLGDDGLTWKFFTKCKCDKTRRVGMCVLCHFTWEHDDTHLASKSSEVKLSAVNVLLIPRLTRISLIYEFNPKC